MEEILFKPDIKTINAINENIKKCKTTNEEIKFNLCNEKTLLESIKIFGTINNKNILNFKLQNIKFVKKRTDSFCCNHNYIYDFLCFFISKTNEYVLAYINKNDNRSILFYDVNNDKEIKK